MDFPSAVRLQCWWGATFFLLASTLSFNSLSTQSPPLFCLWYTRALSRSRAAFDISGDHCNFPDNSPRWNGTSKSMCSPFRLFRYFVIIIPQFHSLLLIHNFVDALGHRFNILLTEGLYCSYPGYVLVYSVRATPLALSLISKVCLSFMWS